MLVTPEQYRAWRGATALPGGPNEADESAVLSALTAAEQMCYSSTGRTFASVVAEREFDADGYGELYVDDFTAIESVTVDGTPVAFTPKRPRHDRPYDRIVFETCPRRGATVVINATWGWGDLVPEPVIVGIFEQAKDLLALRLVRNNTTGVAGMEGPPVKTWSVSFNARNLWVPYAKAVYA